jgi:predicted metalloprotease with PDZ domain
MINHLVHIQVANIYRVFLGKPFFCFNIDCFACLFYILEALNPVAPIIKYGPVVHTYTLKRSDTYDGLGILISADSGTRLNHFIREVEPGSPGHRAGLRRNDHIISINNINVENVDFNNVLLLIKQGLDNNNLQISVIHEPEQN